ncbi:ABC transporter ATP-binding protein [Sphingobacteriaceae bacterium]|nr:ABC transporter ATP-binding protein [Sphingobacteriaceae bacterium]
MWMNIQQKYISDIENAIQHSDFSLVTRRLMDLGEEFEIEAETRKDVLDLRKAFLEGVVENDQLNFDRDFPSKASRLLDQLKQVKFTDKEIADTLKEFVLKAEGISKVFSKGRNRFTLKPLNVYLRSGEITGVVGENGNGKTTLLRILAGELSADTGTLDYPALQGLKKDWYGIKNKLAFIPQRIDKWHGTLLENLKFHATIHDIKGKANEKQIDYILFRLGLDKFRDLKWTEISSGYRLRFELAKMLLWKPKLLLLDEPLANLDINAQQLFLQDLRFFTQSASHPMAVILTSQNLHEIEKVADNIIFIRQGETLYNGQRGDFALNRQHNTFEISGKFDLDQLTICFAGKTDYKIENAGTSFIIHTGTDSTLYTLTKLLEQKEVELNYIRDISQSTRKLFHKDI